MKRIPVIMIFLALVLYGKAENPPSDKDKAVACIKPLKAGIGGKCLTSVTDTACSPMRN